MVITMIDQDISNRRVVFASIAVLILLTIGLFLILPTPQFTAVSFTIYYAIGGLLAWNYMPELYSKTRAAIVLVGFILLLISSFLELFFPASPIGVIFGVVNVSMAEAALRIAVPIGLAGVGGLYAEKSGVFNIGLEGFMIFGAFFSMAFTFLISGNADASQTDLWLGLIGGIAATGVLSVFFAVLTIRYKANQIVAGLAVWFIALGMAPFGAKILWDRINSPSIGTINEVTIPFLSQLPFVGEILFEALPTTMFAVVLVFGLWYVLEYTKYGFWVQAAGENPSALDTAGVNVNRVRYAAVILSGLLCGLGGAALSVGFAAQFIGQGSTLVNGRGWIAIAAYFFGNYNPLSTFIAALLFGVVDAFQIRLQNIGFGISGVLFGLFPYVAVLVVLTFIRHTRMPSAAGEPYESEND